MADPKRPSETAKSASPKPRSASSNGSSHASPTGSASPGTQSGSSKMHPTYPAPELVPVRLPAGPKVREWSNQHGFSDWMVARILKVAGDVSAATLLDGLKRRPPRYVRINPLRGTVEDVKRRLEARGFLLSHTDLDPNIMRLRQSPISAGATVEHMLGMTTLQDLASASAPLALQAKPGDVVADLAAAPGVKTLHIAGDLGEQMAHHVRQRGAIVAVEPDQDRMRALRFNLERGGVTSAVLRTHAAQEIPGEAWADKVLLDAPCTGEGTMPKDPNRRRGSMDEIPALCAVQSQLVDTADRILRPGGRLVYATCTFGPEENEAQLQRLLDRGYTMESLPFDRCGGVPLAKGVTDWPGLTLDSSLAKARRFLPGIHPTLGFFVARLRKPTEGTA